jgi:hypothetical protein
VPPLKMASKHDSIVWRTRWSELPNAKCQMPNLAKK